LTEFFDLTKGPRPHGAMSALKSSDSFVHDKRKATDPDDQ